MGNYQYHGADPVSYTHLDVYKRQVAAGMQLIFQPGAVVYTKIENITAYAWGGIAYQPYPAAITTPAVMPAISPGSYTHLDVYKRQGCDNARFLTYQPKGRKSAPQPFFFRFRQQAGKYDIRTVTGLNPVSYTHLLHTGMVNPEPACTL